MFHSPLPPPPPLFLLLGGCEVGDPTLPAFPEGTTATGTWCLKGGRENGIDDGDDS
jgi:hypothetical protein